LQISGWKGVDDPSSIEAWRNAPDSLRKELMNAMDVEFRDRGGLSIGEARLAVTDPDQRFAMDGGIQNVGQIFGGQPAIIGSGHPSYPAGVPGQGVGRLDQIDMSIFDLIPDARIGSDQVLVREAVDPTNPNPEALRALQMKPYSGVVTEDILKTLDARGVNVNDLAPYIGGGAALGLMAAPEDAEANVPQQPAPTGGVMDSALSALDMPYRGYLGLTRLAGGLLAGEGLDSAVNNAVKQIRQPVEETAYEMGDAVLEKTGSPEAATLMNLIAQFGSPL